MYSRNELAFMIEINNYIFHFIRSLSYEYQLIDEETSIILWNKFEIFCNLPE